MIVFSFSLIFLFFLVFPSSSGEARTAAGGYFFDSAADLCYANPPAETDKAADYTSHTHPLKQTRRLTCASQTHPMKRTKRLTTLRIPTR